MALTKEQQTTLTGIEATYTELRHHLAKEQRSLACWIEDYTHGHPEDAQGLVARQAQQSSETAMSCLNDAITSIQAVLQTP